MTTADLFREREWGVGTLVQRSDTAFKVTFVGREYVLMERCDCGAEVSVCQITDWSPYRPTPPMPTPEEWREVVWPAIDSLGTWLDSIDHHNQLVENVRVVHRVYRALKAKVTP